MMSSSRSKRRRIQILRRFRRLCRVYFEKIDDATVKVTLPTPLGPAVFMPKFANYAGGYIVCKQAYESSGRRWLRQRADWNRSVQVLGLYATDEHPARGER